VVKIQKFGFGGIKPLACAKALLRLLSWCES